jgi:hypothetical protein
MKKPINPDTGKEYTAEELEQLTQRAQRESQPKTSSPIKTH